MSSYRLCFNVYHVDTNLICSWPFFIADLFVFLYRINCLLSNAAFVNFDHTFIFFNIKFQTDMLCTYILTCLLKASYICFQNLQDCSERKRSAASQRATSALRRSVVRIIWWSTYGRVTPTIDSNANTVTAYFDSSKPWLNIWTENMDSLGNSSVLNVHYHSLTLLHMKDTYSLRMPSPLTCKPLIRLKIVFDIIMAIIPSDNARSGSQFDLLYSLCWRVPWLISVDRIAPWENGKYNVPYLPQYIRLYK